MQTITNPTIRLFHLPSRSLGDETFGERMMLLPESRLEVPDWYLEALLEEPGWARRLDPVEGGMRVKRPRGAAGQFEAMVQARRQSPQAEAAPAEPVEVPAAAPTRRRRGSGGE